MEAHAKTVRAILHTGDQYLVPFFQRHYSWTKKHWERLHEDLIDLLDDGETAQHFLGPLVFTSLPSTPGNVRPYQLIDGQQRLTTLSLALAALRDEVTDARITEEITDSFLIHKWEAGMQHYKIVPRLEDRETYCRIIDQEADGAGDSGISEAYTFFRKKWKAQIKANGPERAHKIKAALTDRLSLVTITISGENPYEIFESLNSTGEPLEEADLIRNYLFMQVPLAAQDRFHSEVWAPFEAALLKITDNNATAFYRNYLMRGGTYSRKGATFVGFKDLHGQSQLSPEARVTELHQALRCYGWLLQPQSAPTPALRKALHKLEQLDVTTSHPLMLVLLERFHVQTLGEADLLACIADFSSFILRRTVCGDSTRAYGRWFAEAVKKVQQAPVEDLKQFWLERGWPDDPTFSTRLHDFAIYRREPDKAKLMLETLEESLSPKEAVDFSRLQIEHILPQTITDDPQDLDSVAWKRALGVNWKSIHERRLHTLPNLTLSGYNPTLSNKRFASKREEYARSNLRLTREVAEFADWNEEEMRLRGGKITLSAINLWARPAGGTAYTPVTDLGLDEEATLPLEGEGSNGGRYLVAVLDWSETGRSLPREIIAEPVAARTMAKFVGRLISVLGEDAAITLAGLRINRGPLLSKQPARDFRNPIRGTPYGHQQVPGTAYYVLTHSGTPEKLVQLRMVADKLGLPPGTVSINLADALPEKETAP
jgi:hypothetical protein